MIDRLQETVHPEVHLLHRKAARNYQVMQKASRIQIPDLRTRHCRWESPMFLERPLQGALLYHINPLQELEVDADDGLNNQRAAYRDIDDAYTVGEDPFEKDYTEGRPTSLRDFTIMKHLTISVKLPVALTCASIGNSGSEDPSWSLVDILAPNLEYPYILGYTVGVSSQHDALTSFLMETRDRLPSLKEIAGVDVHIPNAKSVEDPDEVEDYLQLHSV